MRPVSALPLLVPAPGRWVVDRERGVVEAELAIISPDLTTDALLDAIDEWMRQLRRADAPAVDYAELVDVGGVPTLRWPAPALRGGQLLDADVPIERRLHYLEIASRAIDSLHAHGLVHGGLGLDSLWITDDVVTFPDVALNDALYGLVALPPLAGVYAAPEIRSARNPEPATDQFALAVIAHEVLSGAPRSQIATIDGVTSVDAVMVEPNRAIFPGAPAAMADVIARGLAAAPAARYPNCAVLISTLQRAWRATPGSAEVIAELKAQVADRRSHGRKLMAVIAAGLLVGAAYGYSRARRQPEPGTAASAASTAPIVTALHIPRRATDRVFVDGVLITSQDSALAITPGLHDIEVHRADGRRVVRRLEIPAGQTTRFPLE
jgi:hypothetical protein